MPSLFEAGLEKPSLNFPFHANFGGLIYKFVYISFLAVNDEPRSYDPLNWKKSI